MEPRPLAAADLDACLAIEAGSGPDGEAEWRLLLAVGEGFCADAAGRGLAGAVMACDYGGRIAVVGPPLVDRRHPGEGLGRRLAERALARAAPCVLAHAPPEDVVLYQELGFAAGGPLVRHAGVPAPPPPGPAGGGVRLRPVGGADFARLVSFDEEAFGAPRRRLLDRLFAVAERACLAVRADGALAGYGVVWPGAEAAVLGPVVAEDGAAAVALAAYLARGHSRAVRLDVPAHAVEMHAWAAACGLQAQGYASLMVRGGPPPGRRLRIHALASRALG